MKIKGVNIGNWLVLEKWMSPALFEGTNAEDEYFLPVELTKEVYEARIKIHRSEYITERDFAHIRATGMNAVRIPVPYFIFGDRPPFLGCIKELDNAFLWAEKYKLKVLIDLHTVPMSQNGFDNGGISGVCKWSGIQEEVEYVLEVLEKLAIRYGKNTALLGIEPLNEPLTDAVWDLMDIEKRYPPRDPQMAEGNAPVSLEFLKDFYTKAYDKIFPHLGSDKYVVFHDGFQPEIWKSFLTQSKFKNVMLDTHQYLMVAEIMGCEQNVEAYVDWIEKNYKPMIERIQSYVPVICGEWCMFNSYVIGEDTKGGQVTFESSEEEAALLCSRRRLSETQKKEAFQAITRAQLSAWECGSGYFYWSYKLLLDTVNEPQWQNWDCWDFGKSIDMGWLILENEKSSLSVDD